MGFSSNIKIILTSLILAFSLFSCKEKSYPSDSNDFLSNFKNPPLESKPKALWTWLNGNVDPIAITTEMEEIKSKGMSGFDIWDVGMLVDYDSIVPNAPEFLGDSSLYAIAHAVSEADRLGLELGLILSSSWNAGGHWIPAEHGAMGLFRSTFKITGPTKINRRLEFPTLPETDDKGRHKTIMDIAPNGLPTYYKDIAVLAIPVRADSLIPDISGIVNVSEFVDQNFNLTWEAPPGDWIITRYVCTGTGQALSIPSKKSLGRMLDHFSKEAMKFNLDYIFSRLESVLDPLAGRSLKYLYTDSYEVNTAVWTPKLDQEFYDRYNYDLIKYLPILDGFTIGDKDNSERFEFDLSKLLSDLIIQNHYQYGKSYCNSKGLGFVAEAGGPGPPVHNVPFEDLKALGSLSIPRGEFWLDHPNGQKHLDELQIVKGIASSAHLYDLPFVEAESFTSILLWQEGPGKLKPIADKAFCEGLNKIVYHTFPHTPRNAGFPGWVYNFGTLIHLNNIWWEHSEVFHNYLARASYLLQQGQFKGHVLYYYGDEAPNFVPPKKTMPGLPAGYDYDFINSEVILDRLSTTDGKLVLPHGPEYDVLVCLDEGKVNPTVYRKLEELVKDGAWMIMQKPTVGYSLSSKDQDERLIEDINQRLWANCKDNICEYSKGVIFSASNPGEVLALKSVHPSLAIQTVSIDSIDFIKQEMPTRDLFLVRNRTRRWLLDRIDFKTSYKIPYYLDLAEGSTQPYPFLSTSDDYLTLTVSIPPNGMLAFAFEGDQTIASQEINVKEFGLSQKPQIYFTGGKMIRFEDAIRRHYISGPWDITFNPAQGSNHMLSTDQLFDWSSSREPAVKYFSGKAVYKSTAHIDGLVRDRIYWLNVGSVKEMGKVIINDSIAGYLWTQPYGLDVTALLKEGKNDITIEVTNLLNNHMVGDYHKPKDQRQTNTNVNRGPNAWSMPWNQVPLQSAGLMGSFSILEIESNN